MPPKNKSQNRGVFLPPKDMSAKTPHYDSIHHDKHHKKPPRCTTFFKNTPQKRPQNNKKAPAHHRDFFSTKLSFNQP
jgi:hypothetical protein